MDYESERVRERFYFYYSFWECLMTLNDNRKVKELLKILGEYMFYDKYPKIQEKDLLTYFNLMKPNLDNYKSKSKANQENGEKGKGKPKTNRSKGNNESENKNRFQNESENKNRFQNENDRLKNKSNTYSLESEINSCLQS